MEENKPIRELAITPILLSLTCAVFHQTGKFYSKRSKLYEEGLELLLEQWDKSREIERSRKIWSFSHLTFQEFLTRQWFVQNQDWQGLACNVLTPHWREVFLLITENGQTAGNVWWAMKAEIDLYLSSSPKLQQLLPIVEIEKRKQEKVTN